MKKPRRYAAALAVLVLGICLLFLTAFYQGFYSAAGRPFGEYSGPMDLSFLGGRECYDVAVNRYGQPIFTDSRAAFAAASRDYSAAVDRIYEDFHDKYGLPPFGPETYEKYMTLALQVRSGDPELLRQCAELSRFLDIYDNGQKRWYLTSRGWELS